MVQLSDLATPEGTEVEKATLGGFTPLESGLYRMNIKAAFLNSSKGGALGLNLHFESDAGEAYRETLWIKSGDAKGNKNYYVRNGKKHLLPGMELANAIGQLTLGKDLSEMESEEKIYDVYNSDSQSEMPTKVQDIEELRDQEVILGIKHSIVNKNIKNDSGLYVPTNETRDENTIDRAFSAENGMVIQEIANGKTEAVFLKKWQAKWEGVVNDRSKKVAGATAVPGSTATVAGTAAPAAPALFPTQ